MQDWIGQHIGKYKLVRLLGEGGMGMVFEALHDTSGGRAAIKVLRPEVASRADITARFFNEARAANAVEHPGIVRIFDCGYAAGGVAFLAMEYLEGETLRARLLRVQRPLVSDVLRWGRHIASALVAAHKKNVIHRDLKPDNIMLIAEPELPGGERAKLLDFGIAKMAESLSATPLITRTDALMGTPSYMAPEQCRGAKAVTDRSDVYSLGIILYQALAGRTPFVSLAMGELLAMHLTDPAPPLKDSAPDVPAELAALVHRMLEKPPQQRPSMEEALSELQRIDQQMEHRAGPAAPIAAGAATQRLVQSQLATLPVIPVQTPSRGAVPDARTVRQPAIGRPETDTIIGAAEATIRGGSARRTRGVGFFLASAGAGAALVAATALWLLRRPQPLPPQASAPPSVRHAAEPKSLPPRADGLTAEPSAGLPASPDPAKTSESAVRSPATQGADGPRAGRPAEPLMMVAQREYKANRFRAALEAAAQAREKEPLAANRLIGLAACHTGDSALVAEATAALRNVGSPDSRGPVQEIEQECSLIRDGAKAPLRNDAAQSLAVAEKAYQDRFYERAAFLAERQKGAAPVRAWELIGRASCGMRNPSRASIAYTHVKEDPTRTQALVRACEQHGFVLSDDIFKPR